MENWLKNMEYLPKFMRDFHDQKNIFKTMHYLYRDSESLKGTPSWIKGHIYVIDCFLWFMARRGYTLQKSRKSFDFAEFENFSDLIEKSEDAK